MNNSAESDKSRMETSTLRRRRRLAAAVGATGLLAMGALVAGNATQAAATTANPDLAPSCTPLKIVIAVDASSAVGANNGPTASQVGAAVSTVAKSAKDVGASVRIVTYRDTANAVELGGSTDFVAADPAAIDQWVSGTYASAAPSTIAADWAPLAANIAANPGDLVVWLAAGAANPTSAVDASFEAVRTGGTHLLGVAFAPGLAAGSPGLTTFTNTIDTDTDKRITWDPTKIADIATEDVALVTGTTATADLMTMFSTVPKWSCGLKLVQGATTVKDTNGDGKTSVGDVATYNFTVANTGTVNFSDVAVKATNGGFADVTCAKPLEAAKTATCTAQHTLTAPDISRSANADTAVAVGTAADGSSVKSDSVNLVPADSSAPSVVAADTTTSTTVASTPAKLEVISSAALSVDHDNDGKVTAGDTIKYTFSIKNLTTGPLTAVTLTDVSAPGDKVAVVGNPIASLAAAATDDKTYSATHVVVQADVDAGFVENRATVTAKDAAGASVNAVSDAGTDSAFARIDNPTTVETVNPAALITNDVKNPADDPTAVAVSQFSGMSLAVKATVTDTNKSNTTDAGDVITYTYTVTNTGNVTLKTVKITDTLLPSLACSLADVAPAANKDCAATSNTYTITAADTSKASLSDAATAVGTTSSGLKVTDATASTSVALGAGTLSLGDRVWFDTNRDGIQNSAEPGLTGVTVTLTTAGSAQVTTKTDNLGRYEFQALTPGTYTLTFSPPTGYTFTTSGAGTDRSLDSDAGATGTASVTLTATPVTDSDSAGLKLTNPTVDAGMIVGTTTGPVTSYVTSTTSYYQSNYTGSSNTYTGGNAARIGGFAGIALGLGFVARLIARRRRLA